MNEGKCKELRISFSRSPPDFNPIVVNSKDLECVHKAKMLGVTFSVDLIWNAHVDEIVKKDNKRLYFLRQLKRAQVKSKELVLFLHVLDLLRNTHAHFFTAAYLNIYQLIQKDARFFNIIIAALCGAVFVMASAKTKEVKNGSTQNNRV